ncbi:hypothetical protein [Roseofilum casamattae]|uniref:Uncharacterized protein n=1 Tax=Roseofilum casamattae BLCC-M143 TaxID=3022442 RepID=A0ABT7BR73_9CYAN|nr:hypothetical protein [Roseofilum casamattae]MDJ1181696.1 hypothetical protein [Roseofilum casamattae BLCC-M143]
MSRWREISAIAVMSLGIASCSPPETVAVPEPVETDSSVVPPPTPAPPAAEARKALDTISLLTPSTNPEERLAQLQEQKRDPFSPLQANPIVVPVTVTPPSAISKPQVSAVPEVTVKPNPAPLPAIVPPPPPTAIAPPPPPIPVAQLPTLQPSPIEVVSAPPVAIAIEPIAVEPPPKSESVQVTGVAELPDGMRAIVKAPDEPTSRYVVAGESLSNGEIRVKRIEIASSGNPIVVLEENGQEFVKTVSDRLY